MYSKAKSLAMNNGEVYHLVAALKRGKQFVKLGTNSRKTHPKFRRTFTNGPREVHSLHAEMSVLRFARPGDDLIVMRFRADGSRSMARPCPVCQKYIEEAGIRRVHYSNWSGDMVKM